MRRACARPSCPHPATASLLVDLRALEAVLVDLTEPPSGHHHLCARHAASTTVPVGWAMADARSSEAKLWEEIPEEPSGALRAVRVHRQRLPTAEIDLESLPFEAGSDPSRIFARSTHDEPSSELAESLDVASPLLARAFSAIRTG